MGLLSKIQRVQSQSRELNDVQQNIARVVEPAVKKLNTLLDPSAWRVVGAQSQPPFQNSWVSYDSAATYELPSFFKDPLGIVHVRGAAKGGTTTVVFTLPAGYRPHRERIYPCRGSWSSAEGVARVDVKPTGEVIVVTIPTNVAADFLSLELSFLAEQ